MALALTPGFSCVQTSAAPEESPLFHHCQRLAMERALRIAVEKQESVDSPHYMVLVTIKAI